MDAAAGMHRTLLEKILKALLIKQNPRLCYAEDFFINLLYLCGVLEPCHGVAQPQQDIANYNKPERVSGYKWKVDKICHQT